MFLGRILGEGIVFEGVTGEVWGGGVTTDAVEGGCTLDAWAWGEAVGG